MFIVRGLFATKRDLEQLMLVWNKIDLKYPQNPYFKLNDKNSF